MKEILIVDDETALLKLLPKILRKNFTETRISTYSKLDEAITRIQIGEPVFDLVITDFKIFGDGGGFEIINASKEKSGGTKVILISGFLEDSDLKKSSPDAFFYKPFVTKDLIQKIRELLPDIK